MANGLEVRRVDVLAAAASLLIAGGLSALTTNALAQRAQCSKKTIYALYPDKNSLLAAMVTQQASQLSEIIEAELINVTTEHLEKLGSALIAVLLSETSIAINKAAIADASGQLSALLKANGRDRFVGRIGKLLAANLGLMDSSQMQNALFQSFYGLLLGDTQIAALHGAPNLLPNEKARLAIASRALNQMRRIYC